MTDTRKISDPPAGAVPLIYAALLDAAEEIGAVRKEDRNTGPGGYNFRGIDRVVNASVPAFHKHGILVFPTVLGYEYRQQAVGSKGTLMQSVVVTVRYTFVHSTDGSSVEAVVIGEAGDSGDKAGPKAMSVAFRTALLQTLMLPTDDPDPDSYTYGRDEPAAPAVEPPSTELVVALLALAPADLVGAQRVSWVQEQAKAHGYDHMNGAQMGALLDELRAERTLAAAGASREVHDETQGAAR